MTNLNLSWTIIVQLIMFLLAMAILSRLLFKPMLAVFAKRAGVTEGPHADAARLRKDAETARRTVEENLAQTRREVEKLRAELLAKAGGEERDAVTKARSDAAAAMADSRRALEATVATARARLARDADELADALANKLLEIQR